MLDRKAFLRPIAHRGLHDAAKGIIENTAIIFKDTKTIKMTLESVL